MKNYRTWGKPPYEIAVVHGGPGATGEMAEVADELSKAGLSILEPLQTDLSIDGQVDELHDVLIRKAAVPVILIGHSWGAWLIFIFASQYSEIVKKLILIGSGPFEAEYAVNIHSVRHSRLSQADKVEMNRLWAIINSAAGQNNYDTLARIGELAAKADTYDPLPSKKYELPEGLTVNADIYKKVMPDALELRRSGRLLAMGEHIKCPVIAIHGDYDPHPVAGVKEPLSRVIGQFRFIELEKCGHEPWRERDASETFFRVLKDVIM